jgi:hypothetical protein
VRDCRGPVGVVARWPLTVLDTRSPEAGFTKDRKIGKHRWVVVKDVKPPSGR